MATVLPYRDAPALAAEDPTDAAMSMPRTGLFFIAVISVGVMVVAIMNLVWGAGSKVATGGAAEASKKSVTYPNKMRDYIVLAGSILVFIVSLPSVYNTYPKRG